MFGGNEIVFQDYDYEQEVGELQDYERKGNIGILKYGLDDAFEDTYSEKIVIYRNPVVRGRAEIMAEQQHLLRLGVFEDDSSVSVQQRLCVNN